MKNLGKVAQKLQGVHNRLSHANAMANIALNGAMKIDDKRTLKIQDCDVEIIKSSYLESLEMAKLTLEDLIGEQQ